MIASYTESYLLGYKNPPIFTLYLQDIYGDS